MDKPPLSRVIVGGLTVAVKLRDMDDFGCFDSDERTIYVSPRALVSGKRFLETLEHEVGHASRYIGGIAYCERYEEEAIQRNHDNIFRPAWNQIMRNICVRKLVKS